MITALKRFLKFIQCDQPCNHKHHVTTGNYLTIGNGIDPYVLYNLTIRICYNCKSFEKIGGYWIGCDKIINPQNYNSLGFPIDEGGNRLEPPPCSFEETVRKHQKETQ